MTQVSKQRLIGIIVLVFLALVIVPWLVTNKPPTVVEKKLDPKPTEQVTESVTTAPTTPPIPNSVEPIAKVIAPEQPDTVTTAPAATETQSAPPPMTNTVTIEAPNELGSAKITGIESTIMHTKPAESADKLTLKKVTLNNTPERSIKLTKPKISPNNKLDKNDWVIQLGSFGNKENADKLIKSLRAEHYCVHVKTICDPENKLITKVFVNSKTKLDAQTMIKKIAAAHNIQGIVVKMPHD